MKIRKIELYLQTGIDHEFEINNQYPMEDMIKENKYIRLQREIGIKKLREYILQYYPNNDEEVEILENYIFTFNHTFYVNNLDKILFIFKEYPYTLDDYIFARLSFVDLIGLEISKIKPEEDLEKYKDPKAAFQYLYKWKPEIDKYLPYATELDRINGNIITFKAAHSELNQLEINEIYFQMIDYKKWEASKLKLNTIIIPKKKNPIRVIFLFLKSERNKLMSRRIYRPSTIEERIDTRKIFYRIFINCNLKNFTKENVKELCDTMETIIYTRAAEYPNRPDTYNYYVELVKTAYMQLCELITESKSIVPAITEFIIKEGNVNEINIKRINNILTNMTKVSELSFPQPSQEGYYDPLDRPWTKVRKR